MHFSDRKHILRLAAQQEDIKRIFDRFAREAGAQLERWTPKAAPGIIHPSDVWLHNRVAEKRIEKLLDQLHTDLVSNIDANTRAAWEDSNRKVDEMIRDFIADIPLSETFRRGMFTRNAEGLRAFMQRKHAGMNLSDRIWSVVEGARENMEFYLASGIAEGRPATLLSQDIRYILKEPDKRFRRVRNADGKLVLSQPMKDYHPGRGVYRSSYMNALRVGATETNIAYHESDHQRWQSLDFVLGVKVERSGTSAKPCPVCDAMKGTYPKGFKFLPWHPFCICRATPVMLSGQEFTDYLVTGRMPAGRVLRDMPASALEYVEQHHSYRTSYSYLHNVPFFDKEAAANVSEGDAPAKPLRPEKTAWQKEDIQRRWNTRVSTNRHAATLEAIAADFADVHSITLLGGKVSGRIAAGADPSEVDALMARLRHKIEVKKAWEARRELNKPPRCWEADEYVQILEKTILTRTEHKQVWRRERPNDHPLGYIRTGNSFEINGQLREGAPLRGDDLKTAKALDAIIERNTLPQDVLLYRMEDSGYIRFLGCDSVYVKEIVSFINDKAGDIITDPGFKSTSCVEELNIFKDRRSVRVNIRAKKGAHAFVSDNYPESEVILPRGSKLKLISARYEVSPNNGRVLVIIDCDLI